MIKFLFAILILGTTAAHAKVDYVAIGALLTQARIDLKNSKSVIACLMNSYAASPSCAKIELLNKEMSDLWSEDKIENVAASCGGQYVSGSSKAYFMYQYIDPAKKLAQEASSQDPVLSKIKEIQDSMEQAVEETKDMASKAKLQETYVAQCLSGSEPSGLSVKQMVCQ
jgi:hypothetical protein